jgi:hypothetical protein
MPPDNLLAWLRGCHSAQCTRVEVRHMTAGHDAGSTVATFEPKDQGDGPMFEGTEIFARIEQDAEQLGGLQRYVLLAFREGAKTPRDRLPLRVDGGTPEGADALSSEQPNATGLVAQSHRHIEAMMGMLARTVGTAVDSQTRLNASLAKALEAANEEKIEIWRMLGDIHKHDRERARFDADLRNDEKRAEVFRDSVKLVLPGLVAKILPSEAVKKTALTRLVSSFTQEQMATIFPLLTPDQQVALGALLDEGIKDENKENKDKKDHTKNGAS